MPRRSKGTRVNGKHKPQTLPAKFKAGFLSELDGRTELSRALRTNHQAIVDDIGGMEDLSHVKSALVERFCWLEAVLQSLEHGMANGELDKAETLARWIQAVNSLSGLAKVLGAERRARAMPWLIAAKTDEDNDQPPKPMYSSRSNSDSIPSENDSPGSLEDK